MMVPPGPYIACGAAAGELCLLILAGVVLSLESELTLAEAIVYGIVCTMMALSFIYQLSFATHLSTLGIAAEILLVAAAAGYLCLHAGKLKGAYRALRRFVWQNPAALTGLMAMGTWLGWTALTRLPDAPQWSFLWPVISMETSGQMSTVGPSINHSALSHLLLRHSGWFGFGIFGWLSYGAIGAGTYALARRYAWPETALTSAMVVLSAPRLVYYAVTPGMEMIPAAAVMFALVALYRTLERATAADFFLLWVGISFAVSGNPIGFAYPAILVGLSALVLIRRHGGRIWWRLVKEKPWAALLAVGPIGVFSQLLPMMAGTGAQRAHYVPNDAGIVGGIANLARYFHEGLHLHPAIDAVIDHVFGFSPEAIVSTMNTAVLEPLFGQRGTAEAFLGANLQGPANAWFGPLSFLLVVPAWIVAMVRGPRRLKAVAVSLAGYAYLAGLIPAWTPSNAGLFTVFFVGSGYMTAYMLPPWRITAHRRLFIQVLCLLLMVYACVSMKLGL